MHILPFPNNINILTPSPLMYSDIEIKDFPFMQPTFSTVCILSVLIRGVLYEVHTPTLKNLI